MCANSALIESLECYMEDVVECFEEFVKKTLIIITVAAGALVAMGMYLLKNLRCRGASITGASAAALGPASENYRGGSSGRGANALAGGRCANATCSSTTDLGVAKGSKVKQILAEELHSKPVSRSNLKGDIRDTFCKTSEITTDGKNLTEKITEVSSKENVLVKTSKIADPKKCKSSCSGKSVCTKLARSPSNIISSTVGEDNPSPSNSSRGSSCESLQSRILSRESAPSICSKVPCPAKPHCQSSGLCSFLPICQPKSPCKRKSPVRKRTATFAPTCPRPCMPIPNCMPAPSCRRTCSRLGKTTIPSLISCNPPCKPMKYPIRSCNIPKRCPSKPCGKPSDDRTSCCSLCCDEDDN